jgi:hypothetical protein
MLCLEMHSNVMLHFMVEALQDPPLCSSNDLYTNGVGGQQTEERKVHDRSLLEDYLLYTYSCHYPGG